MVVWGCVVSPSFERHSFVGGCDDGVVVVLSPEVVRHLTGEPYPE